MGRAPLTPAQTTGPFFPIGMLWDPELSVVATPGEPGERIRIEGRVIDGAGEPLRDVLVEIWQADADGHYRHPADRWDATPDDGFTGFGRSGIAADGCFAFETIRPGRVALPDGSLQAPHVVLQVFGRGLLDHLTTRIYFPGDPANATDPILSRLADDRRATLIARPATDDAAVLRFDVVLQGPVETVFLDT